MSNRQTRNLKFLRKSGLTFILYFKQKISKSNPRLILGLGLITLLLFILFANSEIQPAYATEPIGVLDGITSEFIVYGWALDQDTPNQSAAVHIYIDGQLVDAITTSILRPNVNQTHGVTGNHGYEWQIPNNYLDGVTHTLKLYVINTGSGTNQELSNSPDQFQNQAPVGSLSPIDSSYVLSGSAYDPDQSGQPIDVHFYIDGPAGTGQLIGSTMTNESNTFSWPLPPQYHGSARNMYAYGIDSATGNNNALLANSPQTIPPFGNAEIRGLAGPSDIVIKTTDRLAGAIDSLTWFGKEFVDSFDHGRQMQSASTLSGHEECFNPTEAGSRSDGTGPTSTSQLQGLSASGNILSTQTQMAFWLQPGETSVVCGTAVNDTSLSNHILNKQVTIGFQGMPHVIEYLTTYTLPANEVHSTAKFEATTGYMPANHTSENDHFDRFWLYDPNTGTLTQDNSIPQIPNSNDVGSEQALPVIISTPDNAFAMGVYSPDLPQNDGGYGRFNFTDEAVTKWNCVFRETSMTSGGQYSYRCYVIVGSLQNVTDSMDQLHTYFNGSPPPPTPTTTPTPTTENSTVANYRADFNTNGASGCLQYLWNKDGPIGDSSNYALLQWDNNYKYDGDGDLDLPDPGLDWGHLHALGGHPGPSVFVNGSTIDRYVIVGCTVDQSGNYTLSNATITNSSPSCGTTGEVRVYVNNSLITSKTYLNGATANFDVALGPLSNGDTIYVAAGPDSSDSCDDFEWDFSIVQSSSLPPTPTPTPAPSTTFANYQTDFQSNSPSGCWQYLWNKDGPIGDSSNYALLQWDNSYKYDGDGDLNLPDPGLDWGHLHALGGHPGPSVFVNGSTIDRYVIAGCTVDQGGNYTLSNAAITNSSPSCGTTGEVRVYVNNSLITSKTYLNGATANFDVALGPLSNGDTIYVAAGPDSSDSCDDFEWDFSIER